MALHHLLLLLLLLLPTILFFLLLVKRNPPRKSSYAAASTSISIKPYPIIGNLLLFVKNRNRFLDWITDLLSSTPTGTITVAPFVFTVDPAVVEHISRTRFPNYQKGAVLTTALHDFLGHGIFNANGEMWSLQRKAASFEFNTRSLRTFLLDGVRNELDTRLLPLLAQAARTDATVDLQDVFERFAFDNICTILFGTNPNVLGGSPSQDGERFFRAFEDATHLSVHRWSYPFHWMWKLLRWLNIGSEGKLRASIATVNASIEAITSGNGSHTRSDLLSRFAASGEHSEESVRDFLVSFLLAGRDTTPSALTWFFWTILSEPRATDLILEEIKSMREDSNSDILSLEELKGMQYLQAALTESLRLHPPVPMLPRDCVEEDVLPDGTKVRKGWTVMYSAFAMGRSERVWGKGWAEFRPERWLQGGVFKQESSFKYSVFHAGPRICLGKEMAYIQMKAVVTAVIERFELEAAEVRGEREVSMSLRIAGGLPVRVKERNNSISDSQC